MNLFRKKEQLGCLPSPKDIRDYQLASVQEPLELPESYCLMGDMTSVEHQNFGTCTCNAVDGLKEYLDSLEYYKEIKLSQKFLYNVMKQRVSDLKHMEGDYIRNALQTVVKYGICLESTFPDVRKSSWEEYVKEVPPELAFKEAEKYKGKTYWSVGRTLDDFKQAIYQQKAPVAFGMMWHKAYNRPAMDGRLPLPDKQVGGHALVAIGFTKDRLWIRNSWGVNYGFGGYFYIPFDEFNKHTIWDAWCLTDLKAPEFYEGWCAIKYLRKSKGYKNGTKIKTIYRLRLRNKPSLKSTKLVTMNRDQEGEIIGDEVIENDGYKWQRIKMIIKQ